MIVGIGIVSLGILITLIGTQIRTNEWKRLYLRLTAKTEKKSKVTDKPETLHREENGIESDS